MIRATHSIVTRFNGIVKAMEILILSHFEKSEDKQAIVLKRLGDQFTKNSEVINNQGKQIGTLQNAFGFRKIE